MFRTTYAVGFDLDGTLYPPSQEIDDRIRNKISKKILEKRPDLENLANARDFFERMYEQLKSGSAVLRLVGYEKPELVMEECLTTADVLDLIKKDDKLATIIEDLHSKYFTYLLTSSPEQISLQKLERLGINPRLFSLRIHANTESLDKIDGSAFRYAAISSSIPADEHVYIGDRRQSDILPARELGMKTIAVYSEIPEADLSLPHIHDVRGLLL